MKRLTDSYLESYENLQAILEYDWYQKPSSHFTYHKFVDPKSNKGKKANKKVKYLDDGTCEVCGKKHTYILIEKDKPKLCYNCYQSVRAYKNVLFDVLKLKKKRVLTLDDCKRIVKYMRTYAKQKVFMLGAAAVALKVAIKHDLGKL